MREAHLPTEQPQAEEEARLPVAVTHARRTRGAQEPPPARPQAPQRLIARIRDRATFEALAERPRRRRGTLSVRHLPDGDDARVAYAIGRTAGGAVARNRIRRRIRAALAELDRTGRLAPGAYLVGAGAPAMTMPYAELLATLDTLLADAAEGSA
jgi:ribonuclease P protein component